MSLNPNQKNRRLVDMSMAEHEFVPYPDPDESADILKESIDMAELGTIVHIRQWLAEDTLVKHFAIMLNITPAHPSYEQCRHFKGDSGTFEQVRRTDTWHSTIHSHQYFINSTEQEREIHEKLYGGDRETQSRKIIHRRFSEYYYELIYNPFNYLDRWEEGA